MFHDFKSCPSLVRVLSNIITKSTNISAVSPYWVITLVPEDRLTKRWVVSYPSCQLIWYRRDRSLTIVPGFDRREHPQASAWADQVFQYTFVAKRFRFPPPPAATMICPCRKQLQKHRSPKIYKGNHQRQRNNWCNNLVMQKKNWKIKSSCLKKNAKVIHAHIHKNTN